LEKIKNLIINIKKEAGTLSEIGNDLAVNMNETAAGMNEITSNIMSIKNKILNQSASVSQTHATMEQVVENINKLNGHVDNQSINISQASSAIEEMVANIQSVTTTLVNNAGNVDALGNASEVGRSGLSEVADDIQTIARESEGLLEINSVMENIASHTNLLSMNAAIEAAHAGEAGKGFSVVAEEIRKLAENSKEQSNTISSVLKKMKESIDKITFSTENVLTKFEAIDANIKVVAQQEENIRHAMEEQGQGSKQILEGIGNVTEITRQVTSGSNEMLDGAKEVIRESENLEKATQEITLGMNEMTNGVEQINISVNHVNDLSGKNREAISILIKEVSRFKVE
jgi:methyl-accepting chemotaxis protein